MSRKNRQPRRHSVSIIGTRGYPSYYGGFETAVRKLAPYLADHDWDVRVYGRPGCTQLDVPPVPHITRTETPGLSSNSLSTLTFGFTSCVHALVRKPDVALIMNVANGFWIPMLKARGIPTVVNVDGIEWHRAKWGRLAKAMFRWGARLTAKFADHLVFDADAIATFWEKEFGRTGTFIPYGGEPAMSLPVEPGLRSGEYALLVARFVPENTISEFLTAADEISEKFDVVLVGSAAPGSHLDTMVSRLSQNNPRVHWLGHISDDSRLYSLWQHAGAYFHGHSVGSTNPALVQAMTLGAPIVARDTVYNREVLADAGTYCDPDPSSIAEAVMRMLHDGGDFKERSALRAADAYTWDGVCKDYEAALRAQLRGPAVDSARA